MIRKGWSKLAERRWRELQDSDPAEVAGLIQLTKTHAGPLVGVYDSKAAGFDDAAGKYTLVCEQHRETMAADTLMRVSWFIPEVREWCAVCREEVKPWLT